MPKTTRKRNPADLLNQTKAAAIIGVSRPTVPAMVARGELEAVTIADRLFVPRESAEAARRARDERLRAKAEAGEASAAA